MKTAKKRGRRKSDGPHPIDVHVGTRVRLRRNMLGMSQEKLGEAIGLTFQQVQKYERGANRIAASRLYELGKLLDVPVSFFYDDTDPVRAPPVSKTEAVVPGSLSSPDTLELVDAYYGIADSAVRRRMFDLAKSLALTE
jgi:transcriptional regulator with XRE-family HTH domain